MKSWTEMTGDERINYLKDKINQGGWSYSSTEWGWIKNNSYLHGLYIAKKTVTK